MNQRLAAVLLTAASAACGPMHASFVQVDHVKLGRVVIYRNGVAFYERRTTVTDGAFTVSVPRDRVDDFLKSLTVTDASSGQPLPVSIPREQTDGTNLVMTLQLPSRAAADVVLTYVTEAPAWKPSYRVVVGDHNSVMLEGWAIVDNTSGEDWTDVLVGVGSSSALSFRYDLWSVRQVQRETLASEARFAIAPPTGVSPYAATKPDGGQEVVLSELDSSEIRTAAGGAAPADAAEQVIQSEVVSVDGSAAGRNLDADMVAKLSSTRDPSPERASPSRRAAVRRPPPPETGVAIGDRKLKAIPPAILHSDRTIVVESYANAADRRSNQRADERANIVRNQLIDSGVAPARIQVVTKVDANQPERVRLVAQRAGTAATPGAPAPDLDAQPVGESHFASAQPLTVHRGSSAMVSMVRSPTEGEVVYLYDAESERGNARFAFRAVRFKNPTDSTLETGPVTVYGNARFIGEGLTEPIPPRASAVVPYALDRQIIVERTDRDDDKISRLVALSRGILTAQVQHVRRRQLTVTNRLDQVAKVFLRHTVTKGWTLIEAPPAFERIGDAHLFEVDLAPHEVKQVMIAEATPIERKLDLSADPTLEMMKVWVEAPEATRELKDSLHKLLAIHKTLIDRVQDQDSMRRRLADYRERTDELHAQILSLQAVRTGGELMAHLKLKMKEISDRVQKATIEIVDQEEKIMLARVQFQDTLSELALPDALAASSPAATR
jgi:hypothetical protein